MHLLILSWMLILKKFAYFNGNSILSDSVSMGYYFLIS